MAHIVFIAVGMTSPLNAGLELSRRLAEAGHRVTFMSHADIGGDVAAHGFDFVGLTPDDTIRRGAFSSGIANPVARLRGLLAQRRRSITSDEIAGAVRALQPDLLLIDIEMHYATIATAHLNIPTLLAMSWFSPFRLPGLPPLNTRLTPPDGPAFRRAWRRVRWEALAARVRHKLGKGGIGDVLRPVTYGTLHYADLKRVAAARGFPLSDHTDRNQWLRPYMYMRLPVLCFNAREMEFPHTPHPNMHYVGPMVNRHRPEGRVDPADRRRWESYKQQRSAAGSQRPLVYCSLGSYWSDPAFLRMVLGTFRRRPEWDLVLGLGGQVTADQLGPIPDNAVVLDWAPQLEALELADCAINHGGITSINEAVSREVPVVVYSPSLTDQDGCAARVDYHGLGVSADWDPGEPDSLERHIAHVMADESIRHNVRAMRRVFDRYEGVAVAVVEAHLGDSRKAGAG